MNCNTKEAIKAFVTAVEFMAQQVPSEYHAEIVKEVFESGKRLKQNLDADETIVG